MKSKIQHSLAWALTAALCLSMTISTSVFADDEDTAAPDAKAQTEAETESESAPVPSLVDVYNPDLSFVDIADFYGSTTLADVAEQEWQRAQDATSSEGGLPYLEWFYKMRDAHRSGDSQMQHNGGWNAIFVSWCAHQTDMACDTRFPKTNAPWRLWATIDVHYADKCSAEDLCKHSKDLPCGRGDLIFFYREHTMIVGIITDASDDTITYIAGDVHNAISKITTKVDALPKTTIVTCGLAKDGHLKGFAQALRDELGLTRAAAVGLLANIQAESNYNCHCLGDSGWAYGLCQWNSGRWTRMVGFCEENGYDWMSIDGQIKYLGHELETQYTDMVARMNACPDTPEGAGQAAYIFCFEFERPADKVGQSNYREYLACNELFPALYGR